MSMRLTGYRALHTGCMYRPYRRPLFAASMRTRSSRALHLMVWTDDAPKLSACLALDVFMADGSAMPTLADVMWVERQPIGAPAKFRVGLSVYPPTDAGLRSLEQLVVDTDLPRASSTEGPEEERQDSVRVVVEMNRLDAERRRALRGADEAAAQDVP